MSTLPTREEIAEILYTSNMPRTEKWPAWCDLEKAPALRYEWLMMADALLARLRPAWEAREKQFQEDWMDNFSQYQDRHTGQDPMPVKVNLPSGIDDSGQRGPARSQDSYEAALDALRADLRACAEALEKLRDAAGGMKRDSSEGDWWILAGRVIDAGAALARPGVQTEGKK